MTIDALDESSDRLALSFFFRAVKKIAGNNLHSSILKESQCFKKFPEKLEIVLGFLSVLILKFFRQLFHFFMASRKRLKRFRSNVAQMLGLMNKRSWRNK